MEKSGDDNEVEPTAKVEIVTSDQGDFGFVKCGKCGCTLEHSGISHCPSCGIKLVGSSVSPSFGGSDYP